MTLARPFAMLLLAPLLWTVGTCAAAPAASASATVQSQLAEGQAAEASSSNPATQTEVLVLREQVKMIREYHSSLLDTVYWALGGVLTLAVLLSGFSWWSNFRVYDADKNRLREELEAHLKEFASTAAIKDAAARAESQAQVEARFDLMTNRIGSEQTELRREIAALRLEVSTSIEKSAKPIADAASRIDKIEAGLAERESELRHVEEYVWDLRSNQPNVLMTQGQGISAAVKAKNKFYLKSVLERMKSTIESKIIATNLEVPERVIDLVRRRIGDAETDEPVATSELLSIVAKVKVKKPPTTDGA